MCDRNRVYLKDKLKMHGLYNSISFHRFLLDFGNNYYLQSYLIICTGIVDANNIDHRVDEMIEEYSFQYAGNYSFSQLFELHPEWYAFFDKNAWPCGRRRLGECRRGVSKEYVDNIMTIQRVGSFSIDTSIKLFNHFQYLKFCGNNKCPNIYQQTKSTQDSGWVIL